MRKITEIIIHHSISPRDQTLEKSLASFDRSHAERLHKKKNSLGYHIAYHYVIAGDGTYKPTRSHGEVGHHASNLNVNKESFGICLTGNFDKEEPSEAQLKTLNDIVDRLVERYGIKRIRGHRHYSGKTCPGNNFPDSLIQDLLTSKGDVFKKYKEWAIKAKLCNDNNWDKPMTKQEVIKTLNMLVKYLVRDYKI